MKWWYGWIVAIGLAIWLFWPEQTTSTSTATTDTVFVDRPIRVDTIHVPSRPEVVTIYRVDTVARKKAEAGNIITRVSVDRNMVVVDKLDPRGVGISQEYKLPEVSTILIDGTGQAQILPDKSAKRRKFWRKVELIGVGVAGIFIGTKI